MAKEWRSREHKHRVLSRCGVPKHFLDADYGDLKSKVPLDESLFLHGPCGRGKTYSMCAILAELKKGRPSLRTSFVPVNELLFEIRTAFDKGAEVTEKEIVSKYADKCDVLFLDDLGTTKATDWTVQTLDLLIDRRFRNEKQTVISSNLTLTEIGDQFDARIASRIGYMCRAISFVKLPRFSHG